jgi:hypothetical protein
MAARKETKEYNMHTASAPPELELVEVYITASHIKTSIGPVNHGDHVELPSHEAATLKKNGFAQ